MLKNCVLPVNYNNSKTKSCGEITCENEDKFIINCNVCKLKIFEFEEFIQHFKKIHFDEYGERQTNEVKKKQPEYEENCKNFSKLLKAEEKQTSQVDKNEVHEYEDEEFLWETNTTENLDSDNNYEYTVSEEEQDTDDEESKFIIKKPRKPKELTCETCGKKYADSRRLKVHVTLAHLKGKPFKCSICNNGFIEEKLLQRHMKFKHIGYECLKCHKMFRSNQNLKRHTLIHLDIKDFVCDAEDCGKAFTTKGQLTKHKLLHTVEQFICEECGYKCRKRESLIVHKRRHTGEKPFCCHLCDSRFGSKSLLCEHMGSHETERKHVCDVCGKSFNRPKALYHHKHLHLGVKKFVCKICGQAYAQAAGLSAHTRKHREDIASFTANSPLMM